MRWLPSICLFWACAAPPEPSASNGAPDACGDGVDSDGDGCDGRCLGAALLADFTEIRPAADNDDLGGGTVTADLDGDGWPDLVQSATGTDFVGDRAKAIAVFSRPGLTTLDASRATTTLIADGPYADLSPELASPGDVTGDGFDDLLVADGERVHLLAGPLPAGEIELSSVVVATWTGFWTVEGLTAIGDVNGNGTVDVAIDVPRDGLVYLVSADAPTGDLAARSFARIVTPDLSGAFLAAGDLNADGQADLAVSADSATPGQREVAVFLGPLTGDVVWADAVGRWSAGEAIASVGDVDGDGHPDLLIGDPAAAVDGERVGAAYVVPADRPGDHDPWIDATAIFTGVHGALIDVGSTVSGPGDLDADGRPDLLIGASSIGMQGARGQVFAVIHPVAGEAPIHEVGLALYGDQDHDVVGDRVTSLGDLDGDGHGDFTVTLPDGGGWLVRGNLLTCTTQAVWTTDADGDGFGVPDDPTAVVSEAALPGRSAVLTDCDDGASDVNPAEPERCDDPVDANCDGVSACHVGDLADATWTGAWGAQAGAAFPANTDGGGEQLFAFARTFDPSGLPSSGAVYLLDPLARGDDALGWQPQLELARDGSTTLHGGPAAGDLDGDGLAELAVPSTRGVHVLGAPPYASGLVADVDASAVEIVGDLDGDGREELAVGVSGSSEGEVAIFRGGVLGVRGWEDADVLLRGEPNDAAGEVVARGGDLDGDGRADLLVGGVAFPDDPEDTDGPGYNGVVYVVTDAPDGAYPVADVAARLTGVEDDGAMMGAKDAGDVTGDGYDDLLVEEGWGNGAWLVPGPVSSGPMSATGIRLDHADAISTLGDLDADGADELMVRTESAYAIVWGPIDADLDLSDAPGVARAPGGLPGPARLLADADADGWPELAIGDAQAGPDHVDEGQLWLIGLEAWFE